MNRIEIKLLKERIDLVKVVSSYQSLEKKGTAYLGLCPFHADRHPSLRVDPGKGLYHCFSCGAGGDALRFVQEKEGCGFGEAVRICAEICHLSISSNHPASANNRVPASSAETQKHALVPTVADNERFLLTLQPYDPGMEELRETYTSFGVGIAPPVVPEAYGYTRRRLVFPIWNTEGALVAFAARYQGTSPSKEIRKYLNSSTSPLYKKDELLYGWHQAQAKVRETGILFITEGYKDTLAMHAAGFSNTVALCGTNLSVTHIGLIRKEAPTVCLFLDADKVGRNTAEGVTLKLREASLRVIDLIPEAAKDPDEMFRRTGRDTFAHWVNHRMIPPACRHAESLLVAACHRWPDTGCLTAEGEEKRYVDNIREVLEYEDLLPETALVPTLDAGSLDNLPETKELDNLYELHTDPSHSVPVRHSELMHHLLLCYLEARMLNRIRQNSRRLSAAFPNETHYTQLLSTLQYERNYLQTVSGELGRRG